MNNTLKLPGNVCCCDATLEKHLILSIKHNLNKIWLVNLPRLYSKFQELIDCLVDLSNQVSMWLLPMFLISWWLFIGPRNSPPVPKIQGRVHKDWSHWLPIMSQPDPAHHIDTNINIIPLSTLRSSNCPWDFRLKLCMHFCPASHPAHTPSLHHTGNIRL
jgi:hypothetical protein